MTPDTRLELQRLLSALCDGQLSEADNSRLEQLLASDDECRRMYLEYVDMHARLLLRPQAEESAVPPRKPGVRVPQALRYAAVAAITLAASLLVQAFWFSPAPPVGKIVSLPTRPSVEPRMADYVATLTHAVNCVWEAPQEAWRVGSRLVPSELKLADGVAHVRFDSGPELLIAGPATVRLESSTEATVLRGRVMFRGTETAAPSNSRRPIAR